MASSCPIESSKDWKLLVKQVGERMAWRLWQIHDGFPAALKSESALMKEIGIPKEANPANIPNIMKKIGRFNKRNGTAFSLSRNMIAERNTEQLGLNIVYMPVNLYKQFLRNHNRSETSITGVENIEKSVPTEEEFNKDLSYYQGDEQLMEQEEKSLLQKEATKEVPNTQIEDKIKSWLNKVGIEYSPVSKIYDKDGVEIDAVAKANILKGLIEVVEGKRDIKTLPEEAGHFIVELLGDNHPLVQVMMKNISNYQVYKDVLNSPYNEIYKEDDNLLRKEAVGKLIADTIVGIETNTELPSRIDKAKNWFEAVMRWLGNRLKRLIGSNIDEDLAPFIKSAQMILSEDTRGLKKIEDLTKDPFVKDKVFYQTDEGVRDKILEKINSTNITYDETTKKYYKEGKEVRFRVSDLVKAQDRKRFRNASTTEASERSQQLAKGGTVGHRYLQMLMDAKVKGTPIQYADIRNKVRDSLRTHPDFVKDLDLLTEIGESNFNELINGTNKLYDKINKYQETINKETGVEEKPTILLEQTIYDPLKDLAGTIDVIVVYSNGKGSIYDFKGQNFYTKNKKVIGEVPLSKIASTNTQILNYISIVKSNYGINSFIETRLLPFNLQVDSRNGKVSKLEFGTTRNIEGKELYREYLEEIPVAKELTGIKEIDTQLNKMFILKENLEKLYNKNYNNITLRERLDRINRSIRKLQLDQDTRYAYTEVRNIINDYEDRKTRPDEHVEGITLDYLNDIIDYLNVYKEFFRTARKLEVEGATNEKIVTINSTYDELNRSIADVIEEAELKAKDIVSQESGLDLDKPTKAVGVLGTMFSRFSEFQRPQFKAFSNLIAKRAKTVREQVDEIYKDLTTKKEALNSWAKNNGKSLEETIDILLDPKTGNLKSKISLNYREEYRKAIKDKNYKWFSENTNLKYENNKFSYRNEEDAKKFQDSKARARKYIEANNPGVENEQLRQKKLDAWNAKHNILDNAEAILKSPYYVMPNEDLKHYSELWNTMVRPENKPLLDVYNSIISYNQEFAKITDKDIKPGFIAEIQRGIFDTASHWGIGVEAVGENMRKSFTTREYDVLQGSRDAVTGEVLPSIPLLFTDELTMELKENEIKEIEDTLKEKGLTPDTVEYNAAYDRAFNAKRREKGLLIKSKDIFKSTLLFAESVYTYSASRDMEATVKTLRRSLEHVPTEITDTAGRKVVDKFTGIVAKVVGMPKGELETFDKYMNLYLYGRKIQNKDFTSESGISANKTIQQVMRGTSLKALGLSWITGMGNLVDNSTNLLFTASEGKYYTKDQIAKGVKMLLGNNKQQALVLLHYFSPFSHNLTYEKANELSISWATQHVNENLFYMFMKKPDDAVDSLVGLGVLQNFGIDSMGRVRNITHHPEIKSLLESLQTDKDKVTGVTEEQYLQIRQIMMNASSAIKGTSSQEDMNLIGTNIYTAMFMQFRNWMPGKITDRFKGLTYDETTDSLDVGRFRVLFGEFTAKGLLPKLTAFTNLLGEMIPFAKYNRYNNPRDLTIANKYFEKFLDQNPDLRGKVTIEDFIELRKRKLMGMASELRTLLGLYLVVMLAGSLQPDDDKDAINKFIAQNAYRMTNRGMLEVSFFFNPSSVTQIMKQPLPIFKNLTDMQNVIYNTVDEGRDMVSGDYKGAFMWTPDKHDKTPPMYYTSKFIPGNRFLTDIFDFYDNFDSYIKK